MLIAALIFLLLLVGCLAGFLFLLVRGDLSPRIAVEKIKNRFSKEPPLLLPNFKDAPYRRLTTQSPSHHPILLNLQTSEGTGQACHPDVAYIAEGFGSGRWRYWIACTPYAYGHFVYENPEIFASHDGIHWTIPDGAQNPLIPKPKAAMDYNSDPDMFFLGGKLWLYFRETRVSPRVPENRIYLTTSPDGVHWNPPVEVLLARGTQASLMSPTVIHDHGAFRMWTVEKAGTELQVFSRNSHDGLKWSPQAQCRLEGLKERKPWHIDVIREEDRLSALLVSVTRAPDWRLHYAYSLDQGNTWTVEGFLWEPAYEFEEASQYRASLLKTGSNPHRYRIWYSAGNRRQMFSIAHQAMIRENGCLTPVSDFGQAFVEVEAQQIPDCSGREAHASVVDGGERGAAYRNGWAS